MQNIRQLSKVELDNGIKDIKKNGYAIFDSVLTPQQADHYKNICEESYQKYKNASSKGKTDKAFHGSSNVRMIYNLHNKHEDFLPLLFDENVAYLNSNLLKEGSYNNAEPYQLHLSTARGISGPAPAQQLHIDSNLPGSNYILLMQMFWALTDMTNENGATRLIPGSQNTCAYAENGKQYEDEVIVNCSKGALIAVNAGVWHGSSQKQADSKDRWVIVNGYSRWWMRPTFDISKNTPRRVFEKLTDEQKDLLGFRYGMPVDEFERTARISEEHQWDSDYHLPPT